MGLEQPRVTYAPAAGNEKCDKKWKNNSDCVSLSVALR